MKIFFAKLTTVVFFFISSLSSALANEAPPPEKIKEYAQLILGKWYLDEKKDGASIKSFLEYEKDGRLIQYISIRNTLSPREAKVVDIETACFGSWEISSTGMLKTTVEFCNPAILKAGDTSEDLITKLTKTEFIYTSSSDPNESSKLYRVDEMPASFPLKNMTSLDGAEPLSNVAQSTGDLVEMDARAPLKLKTSDSYLAQVTDLPIDKVRKLHEAGRVDATIQLARLLWWGGDIETPILLLQKPAKMGIPVAEYLLGTYLLFKNKDGQGAVEWLTKAADMGHPFAQEILAGFYEDGTYNLPVDKKKALELYLLAAKQGLKHSQLSAGLLLCYGSGVPHNKSEGKRWILESQKGVDKSLSTASNLCN